MSTKVPVMFLRVKRPRAGRRATTEDERGGDGEDASIDERVVTICCREIGPTMSPPSGPPMLASTSGKERPLRRYTFERVVHSATELPSLQHHEGGADSSAAVGAAPPSDHNAAVAAPAETPTPAVATEATEPIPSAGKTPTAAVGPSPGATSASSGAPPPLNASTLSAPPSHDALEDMSRALASLMMVDDSRDGQHRGVKAVPSGAEIADVQYARRRAQAVEARAALRCERIGACRNCGIVCIDATSTLQRADPAKHPNNNDEDDSDALYDLYMLQDVAPGSDDDDDDDEHPRDAFDDTDDVVFDDGDDEFSFDVLKPTSRSSVVVGGDREARQYLNDRKKRRDLHAARVLELVNVPQAAQHWVTYDDDDGLHVGSGGGQVQMPQLLADDGLPEGADNYVYFDHRNDDEYDSNAEDFGANEYPEEADSDDGWGDCDDRRRVGGGGYHDDDDDDSYASGCEDRWGGGGGGDDEEGDD